MFSFERKQKEELQVRFFDVDEREVQRCRSMERKPAGWEHTCLLATLVLQPIIWSCFFFETNWKLDIHYRLLLQLFERY